MPIKAAKGRPAVTAGKTTPAGVAPAVRVAAAAAAAAAREKKKKVTSSQEASSTILLGMSAASTTALSSTDIKSAIERGDLAARARALECLIRQHVNGESQNHMIMSVIKFLTPLDDHYIKKLVLYFWEVIDKTDEDGNLLGEIILICSFLRNDLQHPNEYVRGLTLRFLCKVQEKELIEPLVSAVVQNLSHRVAYVRRSAALAVHSIYRKFPDLLPDAVELIEDAIRKESTSSARRAFDMLASIAPERAATFLAEFCEEKSLAEADSAFLMSVVDFCRQRIRASAMEKARYVPVLFAVLQNKDPSVKYQCASTLLSLSSSPTAIRQAALTYIDILRTHADNTVRLIVLEQLNQMKSRYAEVLQESLPDVLSVLHHDGPTEMRQSVWKLATELVTSKTVESFVNMVRKELLNLQAEFSTASAADAGSGVSGSSSAILALENYRMDLLHALQVAVEKFPEEVADSIAVSLPDYYIHGSAIVKGAAVGMGTPGRGRVVPNAQRQGIAETSNLELLVLLKRILHTRPSVRVAALNRLRTAFPLFAQSDLLRATLWLFGAFSEPDVSGGSSGAAAVLGMLKEVLSPFPFTAPIGGKSSAAPTEVTEDGGAAKVGLHAVTTVREDGTYATTYVSTNASKKEGDDATDGFAVSSSLRSMILHGDGFLVCALASALVRLVHIQDRAAPNDDSSRNLAMDMLLECLRYNQSVEGTPFALDDDAQEHLRLALSMLSLSGSSDASQKIWTETLEMSVQLIDSSEGDAKQGDASKHGVPDSKAITLGKSCIIDPALAAKLSRSMDTPILFSQLTVSGGEGADDAAAYEIEIQEDGCNTAGTGGPTPSSVSSPEKFLKRLEQVVPLSGVSDPIYCEASVTVNEFDVSVDWRLINCTPHFLQNIMVDLASLGGMKLCERPQVYSLQPNATHTMRTSLKVGSTETGVIFGSLLYDFPDGTHACIVLNNIDVDIMNYIRPETEMTEAVFRRKWRALDWENKIAVSTSLTNLDAYVSLVERELNMGRIQDEKENMRINGIFGLTDDSHCNYISDGQGEALDQHQESRGAGGCLSCNLAARTAFGEDVLANISVESDADGAISGIVRIRSGTHTLAYGVGKKLNVVHGDHTAAIRGD